MAPRVWIVSSAFLSLSIPSWCQDVPLVQPGAPGMDSKVVAASTLRHTDRAPLAADTAFMQGMIHHHAQAVEMTAMIKSRSHNKAVIKLGERISISQTDEIQFMKSWLLERGKAVPTEHQHMMHVGGHGMDMSSMAPMPGMLTPEQMTALGKASGAKFDRLFLSGMIQHHTGALIMVQDLFGEPATGQDAQLFDFATDVENTQTAEINIMKNLLKEKK